MLKRFNFFVTDLITDDNADARNPIPHTFYESLDITCCSSGSNFVSIGDAQGGVTLVNRAFIPRRFSAHDARVNLVHQMRSREVLVTLGDGRDQRNIAKQKQSREIALNARTRLKANGEQNLFPDEELSKVSASAVQLPSIPVLKFWKQDRLDADGMPQCSGTIVLSESQLGKENMPPWGGEHWPAATCMDVNEDFTQLAIGFENGFTFLIAGDLGREKGVVKCVTLPPPSFTSPPPGPVPQTPANLAFQTGSIEKAKEASFHNKRGSKNAEVTSSSWYPPVTGVAFDLRIAEVNSVVRRSCWLWVAAGRDNVSENGRQKEQTRKFGAGGGVRSFQVSVERNNQTWIARGLDSKSERIQVNVTSGPLLDDEDCPAHCCCLMDGNSRNLVPTTNSGQVRSAASTNNKPTKRNVFFAVAKPDQIKYFTPEDPGACYAIGGNKHFIMGFREYLVVVVKPSTSVAAQAAIRSLTAGSRAESEAGSDRGREGQLSADQIFIYDFRNKLVALHLSLTPEDGTVEHVVHEWDSLLVVTSQHRMFRLTEKDIETKIKDLCHRSLYPTAISLAQSSQCDTNTIMDICRMYGDYLYDKERFDEAVSQYTRTIGVVGPSYVIRKFLDAQRIHHLTSYLEALHKSPRVQPSEDLTTLLLSCYTKQREGTKLVMFVRNQDITFDVDAAITVLRRAKYFDEAIYLARTHLQTEWLFKILVEDVESYQEAIEQLTNHRSFEEAYNMTKRYGDKFMKALPDETCELYMKLCKPDEWDSSTNDDPNTSINFANFTALLPHPHEVADQLTQTMVDFPKHQYRLLQDVMDTSLDPLDNVSEKLWNTLLELSLVNRHTLLEVEKLKTDDVQVTKIEQSTLAILRDPTAGYDTNQALMLVQAYDFVPGKLFLYEKLESYEMLLEHYMDIGDHDSVIQKCKLFGEDNQNMWVKVLDYFVSKPGNGHAKEITHVIEHIQEYELLPPLLVVQILARNPEIPLQVALGYLNHQVGTVQAQIEQDQVEIEQLQRDTEEMAERVESLLHEPQVFRNTKCGLTGEPLEQPTVHFLSGNSYNLRSLPTAEIGQIKDPKCEEEQQAVAHYVSGLKKRNSQGVDEEFLREMEVSEDSFRTISEYFGKCLFTEL